MKVQHEHLRNLVTKLFKAAGCDQAEANAIGHHLVESNLSGHDSHGVIRIPKYVQFLRDGLFTTGKEPEILYENEVMAVVDGQFAFGQVVGVKFMRLALDKAERHGMSVAALRNAGHVGRVGHWAEMAAAEGKISISFVGTSGLGILVAPFGGIDRRLSANPIAVGIPVEGRPPIVVDISTCVVAEGKLQVARNQGAKVKDNTIIDAEGRPTNNPEDFYNEPQGALLPFAGHKGFGLGVVVEALAGALTGNKCSQPGQNRFSQGMLTIVLDPARFGAQDTFSGELEQFIEFVKSARTQTPDGEILMPGEPEERARTDRKKNGIELDENTWEQILQACDAVGVSRAEPEAIASVK